MSSWSRPSPWSESARLDDLARRAPSDRPGAVASQQPLEVAAGSRREHNRVAVELVRGLGEGALGLPEQDGELRRHRREARSLLKVCARSVEEDIVPYPRPPRPAHDPSLGPLQLDDDDDRQARPVSLSQQAGGDDGLVPLGGAVVGDKQVPVGNSVTVQARRARYRSRAVRARYRSRAVRARAGSVASSRMNAPAASMASAASGRNDQNSWNA